MSAAAPGAPLGSAARAAGSPGDARPLAAATPRDQRAELRRLAHEMEGLFLSQLFRAMRESVPAEDGDVGSEYGKEVFTAMMDDRLASQAAQKMQRGIGEALYRQLSRRLCGAGESPER
jgi:flagellar protein FlgJ